MRGCSLHESVSQGSELGSEVQRMDLRDGGRWGITSGVLNAYAWDLRLGWLCEDPSKVPLNAHAEESIYISNAS